MVKNHSIINGRTVLLKIMKDIVLKYKENDLYNLETITELYNIIQKIKEDKCNHYLSINKFGNFSYAFSSDLKYIENKRREVSLPRYINKSVLYNHDLVNSFILNKFAVHVAAKHLSNKIGVKKVKGKLIKESYKSFDSDSRESCMTRRVYLTDLYVINPNKVSLLLFDEVRALLWKTDEGVFVLDRCYPAGHIKLEVLQEWALKKGYGTRLPADKSVKNSIINIFHKKHSLDKQYFVTLNCSKITYYPYLDTFCYAKFINPNKHGENNTIILSNCVNGMDYMFQNTEGCGFSIPVENVCVHCRNLNRFGHYYCNEFYCIDCKKSLFCRCSNCGSLVFREDSCCE